MSNMANAATNQIGTYLREQRKRLKWSLRELEKRSRVSHGAISMIERGEVVPETETVAKLARALGLDEFHTLRLLAEESGGEPLEAPELDPMFVGLALRVAQLPDDLKDDVLNDWQRQLELRERLAGTSHQGKDMVHPDNTTEKPPEEEGEPKEPLTEAEKKLLNLRMERERRQRERSARKQNETPDGEQS